MGMGIIYLVVTACAVICGFLGRKHPNRTLSLFVVFVCVAGCAYAAYKYTAFHILGLVGVTIIGMNLFNALEVLRQNQAIKKDEIDRIFATEEDTEEVAKDE